MVTVTGIRRLFGDEDYQLSTEAIVTIAIHLEERARIIVGRTVSNFEEENRLRQIQGLAPLKRVLARHVLEAVANGR